MLLRIYTQTRTQSNMVLSSNNSRSIAQQRHQIKLRKENQSWPSTHSLRRLLFFSVVEKIWPYLLVCDSRKTTGPKKSLFYLLCDHLIYLTIQSTSFYYRPSSWCRQLSSTSWWPPGNWSWPQRQGSNRSWRWEPGVISSIDAQIPSVFSSSPLADITWSKCQ